MSRIVGIDFGTTNSVIATLEGGEPVVIPNNRGDRLTPSIVAFGDNGEILIGATAKNQSVINCERTVVSVKRKLCENFLLKVGDMEYSPEQIASLIIVRLKECAEEYVGEKIEKAIITVPAYFNDGQRNAVKRAGELAGLEIIRLINEPTAAALAYNLPEEGEGTILVFDLGGGTFDVSILDVSGSVYEVMATRGNNRLGGDDFDSALVQHICKEFYIQNSINLRDDRMALQKVRDAAEQAKMELSESDSTRISVPFISADSAGPKHLEMTLTRETFEDLIKEYLDEIDKLIDGALEDAGLSAEEIDRTILVGGSTRVPAVQRLLENRFSGRVMKNTNPDECVAVGAAIQAGVISGNVKGLVLVDVTPLTLGIETENDVFVPIIERNTCIPTSKSRIFTTVTDGQTSVEVHILQGERSMASKNYSLGKFTLDGISSAQRGAPRIEVLFDIDVNGLVQVNARDQKTGIQKKIEIRASTPYSDDEVSRILHEASAHKEEDEIFLGRNKLVKQASSLLEIIRSRTENEGGGSVSESEMAELVDYIQKAINSEDLRQIQNAIETMSVYLNDMAVA